MLQPRPTLPSGRRASLRRQGLLSVPEGVSDANPARNSRLEVPRSAGAAERRDVGGTRHVSRLWRLDLLQPRPTLPSGRRASLRRQGLLSVPEGVSDANPARNSRFEVPRSAGAAELRDVGGTRHVSRLWRLDLLHPRPTLRSGRRASLRRQGLLSVPEGSPCDVMRPSLAARPRERKEGVLFS